MDWTTVTTSLASAVVGGGIAITGNFVMFRRQHASARQDVIADRSMAEARAALELLVRMKKENLALLHAGLPRGEDPNRSEVQIELGKVEEHISLIQDEAARSRVGEVVDFAAEPDFCDPSGRPLTVRHVLYGYGIELLAAWLRGDALPSEPDWMPEYRSWNAEQQQQFEELFALQEAARKAPAIVKAAPSSGPHSAQGATGAEKPSGEDDLATNEITD